MFDIPVLLYSVLALSDLFYTRFMLIRHGLGIELNPLIPYLVRFFGLDKGLAIGIIGPTIVVCCLSQYFHPLIETLLFARLILFFFQASHLKTELSCHSVKKTKHS